MYKHKKLYYVFIFVNVILQADPNKPILIAGDPERIHMKAVDEAGGVKYLQNQMDTCAKLSKTLNVEPMKPCT